VANLPYASDSELVNATTGINWSTIPSREATDPQQVAERARLLQRATRWVINTCNQPLAASVDQDQLTIGSRQCGWRPEGLLYVKTRYSPILSVSSVELSSDGVNWAECTGTVVPDTRSSFFYLLSSVSLTGAGSGTRSRGFLRVTYTHGYANTFLADDATAADPTIVLDDPTGCVAGDVLTIYDPVHDEDVTIDPSYTGGSTIPLVDPLAYDHDAGVCVSEMPSEVRQSTILAVVHYVRVRGHSTITVQPTGGSRSIVPQGTMEELNEAKGNLRSYLRVI
jgi:hypothetical protein